MVRKKEEEKVCRAVVGRSQKTQRPRPLSLDQPQQQARQASRPSPASSKLPFSRKETIKDAKNVQHSA
jgi:hypothetical protein